MSAAAALSGRCAPYCHVGARGSISGISRGTTRAHLARPTLDSIALSLNDVVTVTSEHLERPSERVRVDCGVAGNDLLTAPRGGLTVELPWELESSARAAATRVGLKAGIYATPAEDPKIVKLAWAFPANMEGAERNARLAAWQEAMRRTRSTTS